MSLPPTQLSQAQEMKYYSVKPRLSGLVGTGLNGPDNRDNRMIENMNINEPRTKLNNLEMSKSNFTQQQSKSEPIKAQKYALY